MIFKIYGWGFFCFVLQSFKLLGFLDVKNVPCARESVLYGSLGSLVTGLGHFLATSKYLFLLGFMYLFARKNNLYLLLGVTNNGKSYKLFSLTFPKIFLVFFQVELEDLVMLQLVALFAQC